MRAVHYHGAHGTCLAVLNTPGRKFTKMVTIDYPVRVRRISNAEAIKYSRDMTTMTPQRLAKGMLNTGRRFGITKAAQTILQAVRDTPLLEKVA